MGTDGIRQSYETGRGSITVRAKAHVESTKTGRNRLVFTEIPYMVNKGTLQEKIASLVNEKRIEGISDMRDESTQKGLRLVIELKKGDVYKRQGSLSSKRLTTLSRSATASRLAWTRKDRSSFPARCFPTSSRPCRMRRCPLSWPSAR